MLCTSGTAAANYHPAICEADESARAADRADRRPAAGAARDRRRPDDRPAEALRRLGALVLRGRDARGRRRRAAPLPLDRLPGASRRRGASRAQVRSTSTSPWREPLAPLPVEGAVTATDPLALEGRERRPLTAVTPIDLEPSAFLLDEVAGHIAEARRRRDRRRAPARPRAARAARPARRARRLPDPRRADLAAALRPPRPLPRRRHLRPACCATRASAKRRRPTSCCASARCRPASRCAPGWRRVGRRPDRRRPARRLERADPRRRGPAPRRPDRAGGRLGGAAGGEERDRAGAAGWRPSAAAREAIAAELAASDELTEPGLHAALGRRPRATATSSTPPRACRSATRRRSCRRAQTDALFLCNRGANGIDGLISSGIGAAHATRPPDHDRHRRPRPAARPRRPSRPARRLHPCPDRRHRQRRRRNLRLPPPGGCARRAEFEALLGTPRGVDVAKAADLFDLPHHRLESLADLQPRSPPAPP